ncbi:TPA: class I SAM-dependent DNA methyltransferase, partial [Legionella pneumophila]|nr:class I SAM-dependent DNA methyltransferase [Legionella pneumophila]
DFQRILAEDTVQKSVLDIDIEDLNKKFEFFLPLCSGRSNFIKIDKNEEKIDLKAASHILNIYNHIVKENGFEINRVSLNLNRFFSRLLYCFFAEDTGLFSPKNIFTNSIGKNTEESGDDLNFFFKELFDVLNKPKNEREIYHDFRDNFDYVNGGLFEAPHEKIKFTSKIRKLIIEAGGLEWSDISPDIFGSMIQTINRPDQSMHFTSQENILKLIKPLFLDELYNELEQINEAEKLEAFLNRLENIVIFDPACGSGNFLIISYKNLRKLEMEILKRLKQISSYKIEAFSRVKLSQFYGIELEQFACEVAKSSLWISEHQLNLKFKKELGLEIKSLPLKDSGNIICGNATNENWDLICPKSTEKEIYIVGNPPYLGSRNQKTCHKNDMKAVFKKNYKSLDYIACWLFKAAEYIKNGQAEAAFVSTNSICQGEQVGLLWPLILRDNIRIKFAHQSFKWTNPAKHNAGVTCVIVGLTNDSSKKKTLISALNDSETVDNITPYLTSGKTIYVNRRPKPLSNHLPEMIYGNMPLEGNHLKLTAIEKDEMVSQNPEVEKFIRPLIGGDEFIKRKDRWCLWINEEDVNEAFQIPAIQTRINKVKKFRESGGEVARSLIDRSYQFRYRHTAKSHLILVPCTSSEKRNYLPCGIFPSNYITLNSAHVIYDSEIWIFGVLSSRMHMIWTYAVAGRLESRIRYSSALCYNTFPLPELSENQKNSIQNHTYCIIEEREKHPEMIIADLYDPETMPQALLDAHCSLDQIVEKCYRSQSFINDEERLEYLLYLYEELILEEKMRSENA